MSASTLEILAHRVVVGLAELAVTNNPEVTLTTYSLGSCLGIAILEPVLRVGGLLHAMLPDSQIDPAKASERPGMFVDTGMRALVQAMEELGADRNRFRVVVAGGAQIMDNSGFFSIGRRNYEALQKFVEQLGLRINAEAVGGLVNRTVYLRMGAGELRLKVSGHSEEMVLWKNWINT